VPKIGQIVPALRNQVALRKGGKEGGEMDGERKRVVRAKEKESKKISE